MLKRVRYAAAGGVVVQRDVLQGLPAAETHLLLLDRPRRAEVRLPKGHIDPGESAEEAALRETCEESGYCDLDVLADLGGERSNSNTRAGTTSARTITF